MFSFVTLAPQAPSNSVPSKTRVRVTGYTVSSRRSLAVPFSKTALDQRFVSHWEQLR